MTNRMVEERARAALRGCPCLIISKAQDIEGEIGLSAWLAEWRQPEELLPYSTIGSAGAGAGVAPGSSRTTSGTFGISMFILSGAAAGVSAVGAAGVS